MNTRPPRHLSLQRTVYACVLLLSPTLAAAQQEPPSSDPTTTSQTPPGESSPQPQPAPPPAPLPPAPPPATPPVDAAASVREALTRWGCHSTELLEVSPYWYAACVGKGVWVAQTHGPQDIRFVARHPINGDVQGLFARGNEVWVQAADGQMHPLLAWPSVQTLPQAPPPSPTGSFGPPPPLPTVAAQAALPSATGEVVQVRPLELIISLGEADGVEVGHRVAVLKSPEEVESDPWTQASDAELVGVVTGVTAHRARVRTGFGEQARAGQPVRITHERPSERVALRQRQRDVWELSGTLRPFLPVGEVGAAGLLDVELVYRAQRRFFAELAVSPIGGMLVKGRDTFTLGAYALVGYDHSYLSFGLGAGVLRWGAVDQRPEPSSDRGYGPSFVQQARIGSRDGIHLNVHNTFVIYKSKSRFGVFDARGQFPIGHTSWVVAHGCYGEAPGYSSFDVGFKRMVRGDGGAGSLFVTPLLGVAALNPHFVGNDEFVLGPTVGIQVEGRL